MNKHSTNNQSYNTTTGQFSLNRLKQGSIAEILSKSPGDLVELTMVDRMLNTAVINEINLPVSDYEFLIQVNSPLPIVYYTVGSFFKELYANHRVRIFCDIDINNFLIVTDLDWNEATTLLTLIGDRYGFSDV